jgi:hypothetical protein
VEPYRHRGGNSSIRRRVAVGLPGEQHVDQGIGAKGVEASSVVRVSAPLPACVPVEYLQARLCRGRR